MPIVLIILFKELSFDLWVIITIEEIPFFFLGLWIILLIETLFIENILVIAESTPGLSWTSNLKYAENNLSDMFLNLNFFLSLLEIEKGNLIFPLRIEDISEIKAEVVAAGPAPSPWIILWPTGLPSTITAFNTPSILAMWEFFFINVGWTLW